MYIFTCTLGNIFQNSLTAKPRSVCIVLCSVSFRHQLEGNGFVIITCRCSGSPALILAYTWKSNEHSFAHCTCEVTTCSLHTCTCTGMEPDTLKDLLVTNLPIWHQKHLIVTLKQSFYE